MTRASTILDVVERRLDADLLATPVDGFGVGDGATLGSALDGVPSRSNTSLLVFLRHFG